MRIRIDFVSNSSSSSYLCDVCGEIGSGWDAEPENVGMLICKDYNHTFCIEHAFDGFEDCELDSSFFKDDEKLFEPFKEYVWDRIMNSYEEHNINCSIADYLVTIGITKDKFLNMDIVEYRNCVATIHNDRNLRFGDIEESAASMFLSDGIPSEFCPICNMQHISDQDGFLFLMKLYRLDKEQLLNCIKTKFSTYETFCKYISGKDDK